MTQRTNQGIVNEARCCTRIDDGGNRTVPSRLYHAGNIGGILPNPHGCRPISPRNEA